MDDKTRAILEALATSHPWVVAVIVALPGSAMFLNAIGMVIEKATSFVKVLMGRNKDNADS